MLGVYYVLSSRARDTGERGKSRLAAPHFEGRKMLRKERERQRDDGGGDRRQLSEMASPRLSLSQPTAAAEMIAIFTGLFSSADHAERILPSVTALT